ncbi:hypothetical protein E6O75_ATG11492 [Venturia nashicola]|uniref:Uncharacterized protein n=1 Tax=Venturia nashicola TaxID=86259 RepID=A0A4Z1NYQ5_9PEZI|nr:hypothetical protein E6O75_ATG11492 [Venturia nashicola]
MFIWFCATTLGGLQHNILLDAMTMKLAGLSSWQDASFAFKPVCSYLRLNTTINCSIVGSVAVMWVKSRLHTLCLHDLILRSSRQSLHNTPRPQPQNPP